MGRPRVEGLVWGGLCGAGTPARQPPKNFVIPTEAGAKATAQWRDLLFSCAMGHNPFPAPARTVMKTPACLHSRFCSMLAPRRDSDSHMPRLTARFLLLFALVGTVAPPALAAIAAPSHNCCVRKGVRQCHGSSPESDQHSIRNTSCCNRDGCRAATTPQWAHAQPRMRAPLAQIVEARISESRSGAPTTKLFSSQSTRAPPQVSIA
jgi:hypothetical protein